jgi:hypothetical protein
LLQEASTVTAQAQALNTSEPTVAWNAALINLLLNEQSEAARNGSYPLLENIFYGNDEAALDVMRPYDPEEIFNQPTPLVQGTLAEGWEQEGLSKWILDLVNQATQIELELATVYFLRGRTKFLTYPTGSSSLAMSSVQLNSILKKHCFPKVWIT